MGDRSGLQTDLNAALLAVKQKCVDLDERVNRDDERLENRSRGYLGVRRYIYALTTRTNENSLHSRRGRSLTRVYMEQKFYRSKSVPTPEQVQRLEDCTQDYGPNGEERLEFTETVISPLVELIKEDQSLAHVLSERLPVGHGEWDHELAVYEEDGESGLLEDRTLTLRAGDHPYGLNQFNDVAEKVSDKIAEFFGQQSEIRTRELSMSVRPIYREADGSRYTSYGMLSEDTKSKSKSMSAIHGGQTSGGVRVEDIHRPRLEKAPMSTSTSYLIESQHDFNSRYGTYSSGYGRYGELPPIPRVSPTPARSFEQTHHQTRQEEHVYDVPIPTRSSHETLNRTSTYVEREVQRPVIQPAIESTYERKYDFKTRFPAEVPLPEGYHDYYDPGRFMFLDPHGYYQGNCTRPLHYSYSSHNGFERYSDYLSSGRQSRLEEPSPPSPAPELVRSPSPIPEPEPAPVLLRDPSPEPEPEPEIVLPILTRTYDLDHHAILHVSRSYPDYYDKKKLIVLERVEDLEHHPILVLEYPEYSPYVEPPLIDYEVQEVEDNFEPEPIYDVVYDVLNRRSDIEYVQYIPKVPSLPPPSPPPAYEEEVYVAEPINIEPLVIEPLVIEPPVPAERHHQYDEIYVGQDALAVSVSPTFGQSTDQKNLGLEVSVHDRVREMERSWQDGEKERREKEEREAKYRELQNQIRIAREEAEASEYNAYAEVQVVQEPAPPSKPRRVWVPPPKTESHHDERPDKPLGPVVFHELIFQQGILKKQYDMEHHQQNSRPVDRPVSRAQSSSRPTTPGLEPVKIDFPRLDKVETQRDDLGVVGIAVVHQKIEKYNALEDAHQSNQHQHHSSHHNVTVGASHSSHHHADHHSHHVEKAVYDEPAIVTNVYDIPHVETSGHHSYNAYEDATVDGSLSQDVDLDLNYEASRTNQEIRNMSKHNRWSVELPATTVASSTKKAYIEAHIPPNSPFVKASSNNSTTVKASGVTSSSSTSSFSQSHAHSSSSFNLITTETKSTTSLNRQNIPPPLRFSESFEDLSNFVHRSQSTSDIQQHSIGHVKNLAKRFNKPDEKPISTEQVIYRVRAAPPNHGVVHHHHHHEHHNQQHQTQYQDTSRPRSLRRIPLDEIELHENGEDHITRQHQEQEHQHHDEHHQHHQYHHVEHHSQHQSQHHSEHHQSHQSHQSRHQHEDDENHNSSKNSKVSKSPIIYQNDSQEEAPIRVRRVYKSVTDGNTATSMLSPISINSNEFDEPLYVIPNDAF